MYRYVHIYIYIYIHSYIHMCMYICAPARRAVAEGASGRPARGEASLSLSLSLAGALPY